jgi:hypothetical protein
MEKKDSEHTATHIMLQKVLGTHLGSMLEHMAEFDGMPKKGVVGTWMSPTEYTWDQQVDSLTKSHLAIYDAKTETLKVTDRGREVYQLASRLGALLEE